MSAEGPRERAPMTLDEAVRLAARQMKDVFRHRDPWSVDTAAKELASRTKRILEQNGREPDAE
jgi:hypothetical protein